MSQDKKKQIETLHNFLQTMDLDSFSVMAQNLQLLIIVLDQELKLQFCNDIFFNVVGWDPKEVLGQDYVQNFIPPEMNFVVRTTLREIMNKNTSNYSGANQVVTRYRGTRFVNWNSIHLRSQNCKTEGMLCIGIDITEHHSLKDILNRAEMEKKILLDNISEAVVYYDKDGKIKQINQPFLDAIYSNRKLVLGSNYYQMFKHDHDYCKDNKDSLINAHQHTTEVQLSDGSEWECHDFPLKEDGIHLYQNMAILSPIHKSTVPPVNEHSPKKHPSNEKFPLIINKSSIDKHEGIGIFSEAMQEVMSQAEIIHRDRAVPVLIEGETGTGKEIIAKYIHYGKDQVKSPFIDINCAAITPTIFESELFGYEGGSFTGGRPGGQKGKLAIADGGSLFLDEIGEIPVSIQAKLLRVIQEREYYRVGGLTKITANVRLICATNVNLEMSMLEGKFRKDLFYRLEAVHIFIPPLRERPDDILPLAEMFLKTLSHEKGKDFESISSEAANLLIAYNWPGNVRQLRNVIERIVLMWNDKEIKPEHLSFLNKKRKNMQELPIKPVQFSGQEMNLPQDHLDLQDVNSKIIKQALSMHQGNITKTASYLGISRRSLSYRLKQMGINHD